MTTSQTRERGALREALSASWKSAEEGRLRPASAIVNELRNPRWACRSEPHLKQTYRSENIDDSWRRKRSAASDLFVDELAASFEIRSLSVTSRVQAADKPTERRTVTDAPGGSRALLADCGDIRNGSGF